MYFLKDNCGVFVVSCGMMLRNEAREASRTGSIFKHLLNSFEYF